MISKIGSENKTPLAVGALGVGVGSIIGAKKGAKVAEKYVSQNFLPVDDFVKNRVSEFSKVIESKFQAGEITKEMFDFKLAKAPEMAKFEYQAGVLRQKSRIKKSYALIGGVILATVGFCVSKFMDSKNKQAKMLSAMKEGRALCGYDSTTARNKDRRYSSTTA